MKREGHILIRLFEKELQAKEWFFKRHDKIKVELKCFFFRRKKKKESVKHYEKKSWLHLERATLLLLKCTNILQPGHQFIL
jgi:hypothetical protein